LPTARPLLLVALSLVAGAGLSACATAAPPEAVKAKPDKTAGPSPSIFYPLAVGNAWTYQARGGGRTSRDTIKIIGQDGPWFLDDHRGRLRLDEDGVRDRDRYLLRAPLLPGQGWRAVEQMVVQRFEVVANDAVVVTPAGRFEKCVVIRNVQSLPGSGKYTTEWSYAPGIGLVALKTTAQQRGVEQEQTSLQLVSFDRGGK
jgi:hypothetical protein